MVSTHVVKLVAEYLDGCSADGKQATLVDLCFFVDAKDRTLPSLEEIDAALGQRPNVRVNRIDGSIVFAPSGTIQTLTRESRLFAIS